jgi:hypothetical protein
VDSTGGPTNSGESDMNKLLSLLGSLVVKMDNQYSAMVESQGKILHAVNTPAAVPQTCAKTAMPPSQYHGAIPGLYNQHQTTVGSVLPTSTIARVNLPHLSNIPPVHTSHSGMYSADATLGAVGGAPLETPPIVSSQQQSRCSMAAKYEISDKTFNLAITVRFVDLEVTLIVITCVNLNLAFYLMAQNSINKNIGEDELTFI